MNKKQIGIICFNITAAVLFFGGLILLLCMVSSQLDKAATEINENGGLKAIADKVWYGRETP